MVIIMTNRENLPITLRVVKNLYHDAKKKRVSAEVRLKNVRKLEADLLSSMKELGYYGDDSEQ